MSAPGTVAEGTYSAVVTTGIYCRPGCGGRPLPAHVRPYAAAAAAEAAGFRPCRRCRPDRTSSPPRWLDGPELVCRAVQLVVAGALDEAGEVDLAARLGVSARHLRRLFEAHVGATPDQVARSRRAHFARRLLDDTDLAVTDVAFAAGFGSVRQMNRVVRDVFRAAPSELRARRGRPDRLVADGGLDLRLHHRGPVAVDAALGFLARRAIPGVEAVAGGVYRRTVVVGGDPGLLEVRRGGGDHLLLRAHLPHWEGLIHVVERVRALFDLDTDVAAVAAALGPDPVIGPRVRATPGLRLPGAWDPFEVAVRAVLGQQVTVAGATTLAGRLVAAHGQPVPGLAALGLTHVFPSPAALAEADLAGVGLPARRADTIRALATAVADGALALDPARGLDDLVERLQGVPGVGPWTAHYVALRLGERDAFPAGDLGLRRALGDGGDPLPTAAVEERAAAWRPWRAYAAAHLWSSGAGAGREVVAAAEPGAA